MNAPGDTPLRRFGRLLAQAASLALWRRPSSAVELAGFGSFAAACALALLAFAIQDRVTSDPSPIFDFQTGWHAHAGYYLALLAASWLATRTLGRPALWLSLASLAALIGIPWTAASLMAEDRLREALWFQQWAWRLLLALAGFAALFRAIGFLSKASPAPRRLAAALLFVLVAAAPWYWQQSSWFWNPAEDEDEVADDATPAPELPAPSPSPPERSRIDVEATLFRQPALLQQAVDAMHAQRPGKIDLYAVGFAGDGGEGVFRNEVDYFAQLMAGRFDAGAHTLSLVNSPATVERAPLATLSNLRAGLADVAARMDTDEDLLVLFLTSHGSEDHRLYVSLPPLPLRQIRPSDLRAALDDAGIHWRVVVVSSCYSGGFVEALRDPRTLVITAARSDRSSFGCGSESKITWFGHAFLALGLNQSTDFERAFAIADHQIREWELAQGEQPSVPQIAVGAQIRDKLAAWRAQAPSGAPVQFEPH